VTLPTDTQILITREFDAPRHLVDRAWTTPELVRRWRSGKRGHVTVAEIDLRVGGRWRYVMAADGGGEVAFHGEYREVVPDERLVYTEVFDGAPGAHALTSVTFTEAAGRTTLAILVQYDNRQDRDAHLDYMGDGLAEALDLLEREAQMGIVIFSMGVSLDGYIAGPDGAIDWAAPDEQLMRFHNEQTRQLGASLWPGAVRGHAALGDRRGHAVGPERARVRPDLEGAPEGGVLLHPPGGGRRRQPGQRRRRRGAGGAQAVQGTWAWAAPASPPPWSSWT
jgi:uncharacterized protein YndB with AHSA1/START domain